VFAGLRILANTIRGLSVVNARLLYKTVVLPILTFASPVWFTGVRQKSLIAPLIHAQNEGLRWLLGAFRTTPSAEMHYIGAILPIPYLLQRLSRNAAVRLQTLPHSSQVLARLPPSWEEHCVDVPVPIPHSPSASKVPPTIIHHLASLSHPQSERLIPYFTPPWEKKNTFNGRLVINVPSLSSSRSDRDEHVTNLKIRLQTIQADPTVLTVFTDGSRRRPVGKRHCRTGAGYIAYVKGKEIRSGSWGLGHRAGIYDAEMLALAGSAAAAVEIQSHCPELKTILFLSDNRSALNTISDTTEHPAQSASILFRRHIDKLLALPDIQVELAWVPGHKGFLGNERADVIAKNAVTKQPILHSTISWAREKAKSRALKAWQVDWAGRPHTNLSAVALRGPPSLHLAPFHRHFNGPRSVHTRIIQTITGHGFRGDYYARFVPSESTACPCGEEPMQTRDHILAECSLFEPYRHHLRAVSRALDTPFILGTTTGLEALSRFIHTSQAFAKAPPLLPAPVLRDPSSFDPG
jgi:ribonuclease HI